MSKFQDLVSLVNGALEVKMAHHWLIHQLSVPTLDNQSKCRCKQIQMQM